MFELVTKLAERLDDEIVEKVLRDLDNVHCRTTHPHEFIERRVNDAQDKIVKHLMEIGFSK